MLRPRAKEVVEKGDIFFFYRPKSGVVEVKELSHVQRFYMVLACGGQHGRRTFRMLVIGKKRLPEVVSGRADAEELSHLNWAMVVLTTDDPEELRSALGPVRYVTPHGAQIAAAAKPVGEGRYGLLMHEDHTDLAYVLELPEKPGRTQREFCIQHEASYIVAVRNPNIPAAPLNTRLNGDDPRSVPPPQQQPRYPARLREQFGDRRWMRADRPQLLDYDYAQLLLLGGHAGKTVEAELGVHIDRRRETAKSAEAFTLLHLDRKENPLEPLFDGAIPEQEERRKVLPPVKATAARRRQAASTRR